MGSSNRMDGGRRRRDLALWLAVLALVAAVSVGCDADEEPDDGVDTLDAVEDTAPDIEACPASGALLQAAPVLVELGPVAVGQSTSRTITLNNGGTGQLCFASPLVEVEPPLAGLTVGALTMEGVAVEALDPGQSGTIELTWAPEANAEGASLITVQASNASVAELELRYSSTGGVDLEAVGTLVLNVDIGFVFDAAAWEADASVERDAHPEGLMRTAGATGTLSEQPVPSLDAASSRVYALRDETGLVLSQRSFMTDAFSSTLAGPQVEIVFPDHQVSTTTLEPAAPEAHPVLKVLDIDENGARCLLAVGYGELTVTSATGLDMSEGGTLVMRSGVINLYDPSETPDGDLSGALGDNEGCL